MDIEDVRQLMHYFMADSALTIEEVAEKTDLNPNIIIEFIYGGRYLDPEVAEVIYGFVQHQYKLRDEAMIATLGNNLLDEREESPYNTDVH